MRESLPQAQKAILTVISIGILFGICIACTPAVALRGGVLNPPKAAADFTLMDHTGSPFTLRDRRGRVVLMYFGYTSCPDVCPLTLADLASAMKELGPQASAVQVVFITVDPERDSQERLAQYAPAFNPTFIALRGSVAEIQTVVTAYGATAIKQALPNSQLGYAIDHSAFIYVIDRAGRLRELLPYGTKAGEIAGDVRVLVQEGDSS